MTTSTLVFFTGNENVNPFTPENQLYHVWLDVVICISKSYVCTVKDLMEYTDISLEYYQKHLTELEKHGVILLKGYNQ